MALDGDPSAEHCLLCRRGCKTPIVVRKVVDCCGRDVRLCEDAAALVERMSNMTPMQYVDKFIRLHRCLPPRS